MADGPQMYTTPPTTPRPTTPPSPGSEIPARLSSDPRTRQTAGPVPSVTVATKNSATSLMTSTAVPRTPANSEDRLTTMVPPLMSGQTLRINFIWFVSVPGSFQLFWRSPGVSNPNTFPLCCATTVTWPLALRTTATTRNENDGIPVARMNPLNVLLPSLLSVMLTSPPRAAPVTMVEWKGTESGRESSRVARAATDIGRSMPTN